MHVQWTMVLLVGLMAQPQTRADDVSAAQAAKDKTFPINMLGLAIDPDGNPISNATIYLVSQTGAGKRLATAVTDQDGRYVFKKVPLPIEKVKASFIIFGKSELHGFAWRPKKYFYPRNQRIDDEFHVHVDSDQPTRFFKGDKIKLDLHFSNPAVIRGRVVDENGKPIPNTELSIWNCARIPDSGFRTERDDTKTPRLRTGFRNSFGLLNADVPDEMRNRITNREGRFFFKNVPQNCRFCIRVKPPGFPSRMVYVATQSEMHDSYEGFHLHDGTKAIEIKFELPSKIPIRVVYADTKKPASKVWVELHNRKASAHKTTGDDGEVELAVPPGQYAFHLLPAYRTPYLSSERQITIDRDSPKIIAELKPATEVTIKVVDQVTGMGIPSVDLWKKTPSDHRELYYFTSWEEATRIVHRDRQLSNKNGNIREFFQPGKHRIGVALFTYPPGQRPVERNGTEIDCKPGGKVKVTFHLQKVQP